MVGNFDSGNDILQGAQKESSLKLAKYFDDRKLYFRFHRENSTKTCPGTSINKDVFMAQARGYVAPVVKVATNATVSAPLAVHEGNEYVRIIQELCREAGLRDYNRLVLKVDGVWGERTESAVPLLKKYVSRVSPSLKWIVRFAQKRLIEMGYSLPIYGADGDYGDETIAAVKAFQKDKHIVIDGKIGRITWAKLLLV